MNRQEILNEINKTKKHLADLENLLGECRWQPKDGDIYYFIDEAGSAMKANYDGFYSADTRINFYNCFKTREEAEAEAEKILVRRQLEDIAKRLNKGKKIDWSNKYQCKYYIAWNIPEKTLDQYNVYNFKTQGAVHCLDENFLDVAKREIGEGRLVRYLKGE